MKTLPDMLHIIELLRQGIAVDFTFTDINYTFTVTPELSTKTLCAEHVELIDRSRYLAAISSDKPATAARKAQAGADEAARI